VQASQARFVTPATGSNHEASPPRTLEIVPAVAMTSMLAAMTRLGVRRATRWWRWSSSWPGSCATRGRRSSARRTNLRDDHRVIHIRRTSYA
jgi:hypothetical protein